MQIKTLPTKALIIALISLMYSCNLFNTPKEFDFEVGEVLQSKTKTIGSDGGSISLKDNTTVEIPADAINNETSITLSQIDPQMLFSENTSLIYDLEFDLVPEYIIFNFQLEEGLNKEDISIVCYDPDNIEDDISGIEPGFEYDPTTGIASSTVYFNNLKSANSSHEIFHELLFKRWVVEWDENVEGSVETKLIQMPYYVQPGGTCATTCLTMLTKAYTPYKDRKYETEIYEYLKYLNIGKDDGVGPYTFLHTLIKGFFIHTGGEGVESSGYFFASSLRSKIIKEIDKGHPLILNMHYPKIKRHAILILGYEKVTSGSQKVSYNIIFHNPNLSENMYSKKSFDWLMSEKSPIVAYQVLYATSKVHPKRALQTLGLPLNEDGYIRFQSQPKVTLDYDINSEDGYGWVNPVFDKVDSIPSDATSLDLSLPVWNADMDNDKKLSISIRINQEGAKKLAYSNEFEIEVPKGNKQHMFNQSIPTNIFINEKGKPEYTVIIQMRDEKGEYLDGFLFKFNVSKKQEITRKLIAALMDVYLDEAEYKKEWNNGDVSNGKGIDFNFTVGPEYGSNFEKDNNTYTYKAENTKCDFEEGTFTFDVIIKIDPKKSMDITATWTKIHAYEIEGTSISSVGKYFFNIEDIPYVGGLQSSEIYDDYTEWKYFRETYEEKGISISRNKCKMDYNQIAVTSNTSLNCNCSTEAEVYITLIYENY